MSLYKFLNIEKPKTNLIFNQLTKKAYFSHDEEGEMICQKSGLKLFLIASSSSILYHEQTNLDAPILKSNLQKAIRRHKSKVAVSTARILLHNYPLELFRRLPIIMIEDVCLFTSISILVWYMISFGHYCLKQVDEEIILQIVHQVSIEIDYFEFDNQKVVKRNTRTLNDSTLALHYRRLYGGMKGDMNLIDEAIDFYQRNPNQIHESKFDFQIQSKFKLLKSAFDFHPYPWILNKISQWSNIPQDKVKTVIWFSNSCLNKRKPKSISIFNEYQQSEEWKVINPKLEYLRKKTFNKK